MGDRSVHNCQARKRSSTGITGPLTVQEWRFAESYWVSFSQTAPLANEIGALKAKTDIFKSSPLVTLNPFLDENGLLHVGGREQNSKTLSL